MRKVLSKPYSGYQIFLQYKIMLFIKGGKIDAIRNLS